MDTNLSEILDLINVVNFTQKRRMRLAKMERSLENDLQDNPDLASVKAVIKKYHIVQAKAEGVLLSELEKYFAQKYPPTTNTKHSDNVIPFPTK